MRYGVLGPIEARVDNEVIGIGGPQQRRLLALLLQRPGQTVSTDRMVDCLWDDGEAPDGAGRSVMTYVSRLRSAIGHGATFSRRTNKLRDVRSPGSVVVSSTPPAMASSPRSTAPRARSNARRRS